MKHIMKQ